MKHLSLLCLTGSLWFLIGISSQLHAQEQAEPPVRINKSFNDISLRLALLELKMEYGLAFQYEDEIVDGIRISKVNIRRLPLPIAMQMLLNGTGLGFSIIDSKQVLIDQKENIVEEVVQVSSHNPEKRNFTLRGTIRDSKSGESLPNATIMVAGTQNGAISNLDGYFTLFQVPADTAKLLVKYLGYQSIRLALNPEMDIDNLEIGLEALDYELEEVVIATQQSHMIERKGISQISISPMQIAALPSLGEKDIFRSLQLLPGISGTNETSSGLYVRGGTPDQNLILFDGFTVYHVDHFFGFFSAFNAEAIKDVQLYKGGFEAKYGGRLSSVVELTGKQGNKKEFDLGVGLSLLSANVRAEGPIGEKFSYFVAARRSYTDIIKSGLYNKIFELTNPVETPTGPGGTAGGGPPGGRPGGGFGRQSFTQDTPDFFFYDLNGKLTFTPNDKDVISLSFYNGEDNLDNSIENNNTFGTTGDFSFSNQTTDLTNWGNWGTSTKWARQWNDRFYSNLVLAYSNYFSERERETNIQISRDTVQRNVTTGLQEDNDVKDVSLRWDNELKIGSQHTLGFGANITYQDIQYQYIANDTLTVLDRRDQGMTYAAYLQNNWKILDKFSLTLGGRANYYDVNQQLYLEPRASLTYALNNNFSIKGAWGIYHQFTNRVVREDVLQGSRDFWLLSDGEEIPVGKASHYIAGISYENKNFLIDVEAYYKNLDGLTEYSQRITQNRREVNYDELFYQGSGIARGVELLVQKKVGVYTGWLAYTLGQVRYDFPAFGDEPFPALHDQTHEFKLVNSFKLGNWTFAGTWVYSTGKPYTAPVGGYSLGLLDGNTFDYVHVGEKNGQRLPAYHRMDLSATNHFDLGKASGSIGFSIFNLYGRKNIWYKEYEVVEGDLIENNIELLGITPNLFLNFNLK